MTEQEYKDVSDLQHLRIADYALRFVEGFNEAHAKIISRIAELERIIDEQRETDD